MKDSALAAQQIAAFVQTLVATSGLDISFQILACNLPSSAPAASSPADAGETPATPPPAPGNQPQTLQLEAHAQPSSDPTAQTPSLGIPSDAPAMPPLLAVEFSGPDAPLLTRRNGEILLALEHLTIQLLRLAPDQHERVSFDAVGFKATRHLQLRQEAESAIESVRSTGSPYAFDPMTSRERRLLHLALSSSGLPTSSAGEGPRRHVVLYPIGYDPTIPSLPGRSPEPSPADRTRALRDAFRRR